MPDWVIYTGEKQVQSLYAFYLPLLKLLPRSNKYDKQPQK